MNSEDKHIDEQSGREARWVIGVLCGIVLVIFAALAAQKRAEAAKAGEQIEALQQENQTLSDQNRKLEKQVETLQAQNGTLREQVESYREIRKQMQDFADELDAFLSQMPEAEDRKTVKNQD